ncbi:MAG: sialidase family protein, partial [Planctomycetota bacterium]
MSRPLRIAFLVLATAGAVPSVGAGQEGRDPRLHDAWVSRRKYDGTYLRLVGDSIAGAASAPEGIALASDGPAGREGEVLVAFFDALRIKYIEPGGLASIRSLDGGETWTTRRPLVIRGKRNGGACIDPALIALPDGRIRLFFVACAEELPPEAWPPETREVHSAVSIDAVNFDVEEGTRLALWGVRSPSVVRSPDGEWWMFFASGEETLLARSPDGLTFDLDPSWVCHEGWA